MTPPAKSQAQRRAGFIAPGRGTYAQRFARTRASDQRGAAGDRRPAVHVALSRAVPVQRLRAPALQCRRRSSSPPPVRLPTDLDGNRLYDLTGSYGVNVFGYDFYKQCIERGAELVRDLGPVLGAYHPVMAYNVRRLREISGLDEVSFHMSGTEAVMQAVRLARYHTRRRYLVRFCGAYHGWWGDVQPGVGNPTTAHDTFTLQGDGRGDAARCCAGAATSPACWSIRCRRCIRTSARPAIRRCSTAARQAHFDRAAYTRWLRELRAVCSERGIVLIFDEVFVGFRLAPAARRNTSACAPTWSPTARPWPADCRSACVCGRAT